MPAFLVHGVPDTHRLWDPVRRRLDRDDVIAPDLPGFGAPSPDGFEPTKEGYAGWLADQIAAVGEPVDLVGHDWGSLLALRVASIRPELIRTLSCGGGPVDETYVWHQVAQMWQTPEAGEQVMAAMVGDAVVAALVGAGVPEEEAASAATYVDDTMKACILTLYRSAVTVGAEWAPDLARITAPALVIWGADDPYVDAAFAHRIAGRIGGEALVLEGCGHWWPYQRPAEVAAALERHWARKPPA